MANLKATYTKTALILWRDGICTNTENPHSVSVLKNTDTQSSISVFLSTDIDSKIPNFIR